MQKQHPSLLTAEAVKMIGTETPWGLPFFVESGIARRFARAILDTDSAYAHQESITGTQKEKVRVPNTILLCNMASGTELDFDIPLHTSGRVRGKDDVEIFRPIYIGDTIRAKTKILDINEKEGRSGKMVFVITETQYVNQNQELVMKSRTTVIKR